MDVCVSTGDFAYLLPVNRAPEPFLGIGNHLPQDVGVQYSLRLPFLHLGCVPAILCAATGRLQLLFIIAWLRAVALCRSGCTS